LYRSDRRTFGRFDSPGHTLSNALIALAAVKQASPEVKTSCR
jgi:hypothetical protein